MNTRRKMAAIVLALIAGWLVSPVAASAQTDPQRAVGVPVSGPATGTNVVTGAQLDARFDGVLNVRRFSARDERVFAAGTLSGAFVDQSGTILARIEDEPVQVTVQRVETSCESFRLVLGPVHLDAGPLTGASAWQLLQFDMNELHTGFALPQEGQDLTRPVLCTVTDLIGGSIDLNGGAPLPVSAGTIARILNQVVRLIAA